MFTSTVVLFALQIFYGSSAWWVERVVNTGIRMYIYKLCLSHLKMAPCEGLLPGWRGIRGFQLFRLLNFSILQLICMASLILSFLPKPPETALGFLRHKGKKYRCIIDNQRTYLTCNAHWGLRTELGHIPAIGWVQLQHVCIQTCAHPVFRSTSVSRFNVSLVFWLSRFLLSHPASLSTG